jgi:hypothetical protein
MKTIRILSVPCLVFVLWLVIPTVAFAQSARIAVVGDPSLSNLIDVTTTQLSTIPDMSLLDRADLDKLGQEQALQTVVGSNDFSTVQLLPADGLVILRAVKQDGKTSVFARLVAVQPGIVLRETVLPDGADPITQAKAIGDDFASYWPKLAAIRQGKSTAISLLGLRFETDAPETGEMERQINLLLASRLGAEPDTIVLERWRLNDAVFEKSLVNNPSPFWTGSSLIDGSMTWDKATNRVNVSLRMRPAQGAAVSLTDSDTSDHLADLVRRLADKIEAHPAGTTGNWQPAAEAAHYAELGKWCLDNRLFEEGAQAIESALALGDNSTATHALQIRAYTSLAYTDEPLDATEIYEPGAKPMDPGSVPDRIKWGTTAVDLISRYRSANTYSSGQAPAAEDPVVLSLNVVDNCLRLLRFAYQKGFAHGDDITALRHAVQNLLATLDASKANLPPSARDTLLKYEVRYAPFWHESPEETIAYYLDLLNRKTDGVAIRNELFVNFYVHLHPTFLPPEDQIKLLNPTYDPRMLNLGDWYVGSPRIIAWDDRPADEVLSKWNDFLRELNASPDPVLQSDAIKFQSCAVYNLNEQNVLLGTFLVEFLEKNQQSISGPRGNDLMTGLSRTFSVDVFQAPDKTNLNQLRNLGEALLQQRAVLASEWIRWMPQIYFQAPPDLAASVLASLDDYRKWYQTQTPQDPEMVEALEQARRPLIVYAGAAPQGKGNVAQSGNDFIIVNRRWPQSLPGVNGNVDAEAFQKARQGIAYAPSIITAENKVWALMLGGKLVKCVDPSTLQTVATYTVPLQENHDPTRPESAFLGVTPQYLVVTASGEVMLCSRSDQSWRTLDLPLSNYKPCWVNQQLYLLYDAGTQISADRTAKNETAASAISGVIRVSLPDGGIDNLVSTRRIPPQSPLDGKPLGYLLNLWNSPVGLMLAVIGNSPPFQVFTTPAGKNDWTPVSSDPLLSDVKLGDGGALIGKGFDYHGFAQIVLMNGTDGQVLLSNPNRAPAGGNPSARWELPDDFRAMSPNTTCACTPVMRGKDLCLYTVKRGDTGDTFDACLYYFAQGQKTGVKIPLEFTLAPLIGPNSPRLASMQSVIHDFQSLQATDYGLIIVQEFMVGGFCVIPWSDIDAYRAKVASQPVTAGPDAPPVPVEGPASPAIPLPAPPSTPAAAPVPITPPTLTPVVKAPITPIALPNSVAPPAPSSPPPVTPTAPAAPLPPTSPPGVD